MRDLAVSVLEASQRYAQMGPDFRQDDDLMVGRKYTLDTTVNTRYDS